MKNTSALKEKHSKISAKILKGIAHTAGTRLTQRLELEEKEGKKRCAYEFES